MLILWGAFGIAALMHPGAYFGVEASPATESMTGAPLFGFIVLMNGNVILLIAGGNIFARFGQVTPGLVVLLVQGVQIGWLAGSKGFETRSIIGTNTAC